MNKCSVCNNEMRNARFREGFQFCSHTIGGKYNYDIYDDGVVIIYGNDSKHVLRLESPTKYKLTEEYIDRMVMLK
jgi:hypothetical protein